MLERAIHNPKQPTSRQMWYSTICDKVSDSKGRNFI